MSETHESGSKWLIDDETHRLPECEGKVNALLRRSVRRMVPKRFSAERKYSVWLEPVSWVRFDATKAARRVSMVRELQLLTVGFVFAFLGAIVMGVF